MLEKDIIHIKCTYLLDLERKLNEIGRIAEDIFLNADRIKGDIGTGDWRNRIGVKEDALKILRLLCND